MYALMLGKTTNTVATLKTLDIILNKAAKDTLVVQHVCKLCYFSARIYEAKNTQISGKYSRLQVSSFINRQTKMLHRDLIRKMD